MFKNKKRIYFDNAASTPIDKKVLFAMRRIFRNNFYNPSGLYKESLIARKIIDDSRKKVAKILKSLSDEIIFTQGGTEANNIAILGLVNRWKEENIDKIPHIIISKIEHSSVSEICKYLEVNNIAEISRLSVDNEGLISIKELKEKIKENTILVSIIYANNEIGVVQDIKNISKTIRWHRKNNETILPYFHTDAVQAVNYLEINVQKLGINMMTINASKIYGPKMIGILYKNRDITISPIIFGGSQEFKLRSGTENTPFIVGITKSLEITTKIKEEESKRLEILQKYFFDLLEKNITEIIINGSREYRLPNNVHISVPGISSEELLLRLDKEGILCSTKSACKNEDSERSDVIDAIGGKVDYANIRFTMGRMTKKRDIEKCVKKLVKILDRE